MIHRHRGVGKGIVVLAAAGLSMTGGCNVERPNIPSEESIVVPGEGQVVIYVEVPRRVAGPILSTFTQQSGVEVKVIYRESLRDNFFAQLETEASAGRVDLFWGESPLSAMGLAEAGLAVPFRPAGARPVPTQYRDPGFRWIGFAVNPRVILYNTDLLERSEAPQSIWDMANHPWGGRGAMAAIVSGAPAFHAAVMITIRGGDDALRFLEDVRTNGTRIVEDDASVRRLVESGEVQWGILGLDEAICSNREGEPVHIFFPDRFNIGAVVVPHVAVLLRGAPNLAQAKGLYAYLFSIETAWQFGQDDCALVTLIPGVPRPQWVPSLSVFNVSQLDNQAVFEAYQSNADRFLAWKGTGPGTGAQQPPNR